MLRGEQWIYLKPEVVIILDRVKLSEPRSVQARFQVFNDDDKGQVAICEHGFKVTRPHASLHTSVATLQTRTIEIGHLPIEDEVEKYPFAEISCPASNHHEILTLATATPTDDTHGKLTCEHSESGWHIQGEHGGREINVTINTEAEIPQILL